MMNFLKNIANKTINAPQNLNVSDEDRDLLAVSCETCLPVVHKGIFLRRAYSYYFPVDENNLDFVIGLFEKYGLTLERRESDRRGYIEHFIRIAHKNKVQGEKIADLMRAIGKRKQELVMDFYTKREKSVWWKLQGQIMAMNQIQK